MKALILSLLCCGLAQAATSFNYAAATDGSYTCPQSCFGFTTSLPPNTVDSVGMSAMPNVQFPTSFDITISVDAVQYRNQTVAHPGVAALYTARDGSGRTIMATVVYNTVRICNVTCHWHYHATGGTVSTP